METPTQIKGRSLVTFLIIMFRFFKVVFLIAFIIMVLVGLYALTNLGDTMTMISPVEFQLFFSYNVDKSVINWPNQTSTQAILTQGMSGISVENIPGDFMLIYSLMSIVGMGLILISIHFTIKILRSVKEGSFLLVKNAIRLRWIALLTIVTFIVDKLSAIYASGYLSNKIDYPQLDFTSVNIYSMFNFESIFSALFLLVIAEVFRIGANIKQEYDLTI